MRVVMVADAHLEGLDDPKQAGFVRWLDGLAADELVLLGDIFHHWWGYPGAVLTPYVPVCAALLRVRERGVSVVFVPGNHDFAAGPFFRETLGAQVLGAHVRELDGVRYLLAHGDEADTTVHYRLARAALHGRGFALGMRCLGPDRGYRLIRFLARVNRESQARAERVLQAQRRWAEGRVAAGADAVVVGHCHIPCTTPLAHGTLFNLGAWSKHRTCLVVEGGGACLHHGTEVTRSGRWKPATWAPPVAGPARPA